MYKVKTKKKTKEKVGCSKPWFSYETFFMDCSFDEIQSLLKKYFDKNTLNEYEFKVISAELTAGEVIVDSKEGPHEDD